MHTYIHAYIHTYMHTLSYNIIPNIIAYHAIATIQEVLGVGMGGVVMGACI